MKSKCYFAFTFSFIDKIPKTQILKILTKLINCYIIIIYIKIIIYNERGFNMEENGNDIQNIDEQNDFKNVEGFENTNPINDSSTEVKSKKKLFMVIIIIVAVLAVLLIFNAIFNSPKAKSKKVVKDYIKAISNADLKKIMKLTEPYGVYVLESLDEDDYDDFWKEYKEFVKEKDDEYEDIKDNWEEKQDKDEIEESQEDLEDLMDDISIKVKKIVSVKKEGKNLYRVKVKIESKQDKEKAETANQIFYVMKKGFKYYVIGGDFLGL